MRDRVPWIVVAEDDATFRGLVASRLRLEGYGVAEAADGDDLRELLANMIEADGGSRIDLVITDIRMPGQSGLEALAAAREAGQAIRVLLMSAFTDAYAREQAESLGAALMNKPFSMQQLSRQVALLLRRNSPSLETRSSGELG